LHFPRHCRGVTKICIWNIFSHVFKSGAHGTAIMGLHFASSSWERVWSLISNSLSSNTTHMGRCTLHTVYMYLNHSISHKVEHVCFIQHIPHHFANKCIQVINQLHWYKWTQRKQNNTGALNTKNKQIILITQRLQSPRYQPYLALSFLMLSSHGMSPQNGASTSFFASKLLQKSSKAKHVAVLSSNSFLALCSRKDSQSFNYTKSELLLTIVISSLQLMIFCTILITVSNQAFQVVDSCLENNTWDIISELMFAIFHKRLRLFFLSVHSLSCLYRNTLLPHWADKCVTHQL